jgi:hypothetical protein
MIIIYEDDEIVTFLIFNILSALREIKNTSIP